LSIVGLAQTFSVANNAFSPTALNSLFSNLAIGAGKTLSVAGNWGSSVTSISACGITLSVASITKSSTTGMVSGQTVTGVGSPLNTPIGVTLTDSGDRVSITGGANHGLAANTRVSFATIVSTTGIVVNTIYYVVPVSATQFSLSLTSGGSAIPLTTNGTGTLRYECFVDVVSPGFGCSTTSPMTATNASATLSFQTLDVATALLKGWSLTQ
jgi:hypothetical protein